MAFEIVKFNEFKKDSILKELEAFKKVMLKNNVNFFLLGGCCLGAVREGKLLSHDKDIDIGILEDVDLNNLQKILSPMFDTVHITGLERGKIVWAKKEIDGKLLIFEIQVHYKKDDVIFMNRDMGKSFKEGWREGRIQWDAKYFNTFETVKLGEVEYLVPAPKEEYLTVQHGDWKTPKQYGDWRYNIKNLFKGWL